MRHIPLPLPNGFMTRSGFFEVNLCCELRLGLVARGGGLEIRFWLCSRNIVRLVKFGLGGVQVEGL